MVTTFSSSTWSLINVLHMCADLCTTPPHMCAEIDAELALSIWAFIKMSRTCVHDCTPIREHAGSCTETACANTPSYVSNAPQLCTACPFWWKRGLQVWQSAKRAHPYMCMRIHTCVHYCSNMRQHAIIAGSVHGHICKYPHHNAACFARTCQNRRIDMSEPRQGLTRRCEALLGVAWPTLESWRECRLWIQCVFRLLLIWD